MMPMFKTISHFRGVLAAAAMVLAMSLMACEGDKSTGPSGPTAEEKALTGSWAGQVDAAGVPILLKLNIMADKTYKAELWVDGGLSSTYAGTWSIRDGRYYEVGKTCNEADEPGGVMRPVTCEDDTDGIPLNIAGDTWTVRITEEGQLITIEMKRL
jgi:hypothetical protein